MTAICFTSPKGGVGKTALAANIAGELGRAGMRVIALDLDPQNALRLHLGVPLQETAGFTKRIATQPDWQECLQTTPSGIPLLAYGTATMRETIELAASAANHPEMVQRALDPLLMTPGICIVIDTPAGPSPLVSPLASRIDLQVIVLATDASSVSLIPTLRDGGAPAGPYEPGPERIRFVLNQFDPRTRLGGVIADAVSRHLGSRMLGVVYRDEYVGEAIAAQRLLADYAPSSKAYQDIAAIGQAIAAHIRAAAPT